MKFIKGRRRRRRLFALFILQFVVVCTLVFNRTSIASVTSLSKSSHFVVGGLVNNASNNEELAEHHAQQEEETSEAEILPSITMQQRQPSIHLFNNERDNNEFRLSSSGLEFLGRGHDGHVYKASMICTSSSTTNNHNNNNTKQEIIIAIKVPTRILGNRKSGKYYIVNDDDKTWDRRKELYQRMMLSKNSSSDDILNRYFIIPLGYIELPLDILPNTTTNHEGTRKYIVNATSDNTTRIIKAQIFHFTDGKDTGNLFHSKSIPQTGRRQIVRDLIFMFKYMYERDVVHCDISAGHVVYSISRREASLIDFDRFRVLEPDREDRMRIQVSQLWQLLVLIANMCTYEGGKPEFQPENNICIANSKVLTVPVLHTQHLKGAMEQCGFAGQEWDWSRFDLMNTRQAYEILSDWSGAVGDGPLPPRRRSNSRKRPMS